MLQLTDEERAAASGGISNNSIYEMVLKHVGDLSGRKILDFGCGRGDFLKHLSGCGASELFGMDIIANPQGLLPFVNYVQANLNFGSNVESATIDTIFAIEVIEHLENPRSVIRELFRLLRPGGQLFLTTPNSENIRGYVSLIFKRHFWAFRDGSYPAHINALLELDLRRIFLEVGLTVEAVVYSGCGSIVGFPRTSWQRLCRIGTGGRLFSDNLLVLARKPFPS